MSEAEGGPPALGVVVAGGLGTRIGGAKASLPLAGRPLLSRPVSACREAGLRTVVVAKAETPLPPLDVPVWIEPPRPHHPLCGVLEALRRAEGPALVCAGDMPFVEPRLLAWLAGLGVPLAVPRLGGRLHPLLGLYDPRLLPALEKDLGAELPLRESVERLRAREVTESELARFGEPERLLFNVNTPQDLREAEQVLSAGEGN